MILVIILIIIIILIISSYENFETLSDAYDNLITQFNNNSLTISNINSDKLTANKSIEGNDGTIKNDLSVNNNLSVKNNLNVTSKITSKDANITNSLTTNNITNSNAIETKKIQSDNIVFRYYNNDKDINFLNIVMVNIEIRDIPKEEITTLVHDIYGYAIYGNNGQLQFINCHGITKSSYTGATRLTVAYSKNNLSIGIKKPGESGYTRTNLTYIAGVYYSHNDVNVIYQVDSKSNCYGNISHLYRDSDYSEILPCYGRIIQFTCAQIK